ncbi:hypothetical protein [Nostoc sphaeroides]|uniref:Transposase Tn5-like N-terminal domain-containing protein n=1 Tax=Nostoc sphaeroides CCNUC1 TaxID=2653204 RepID=A0A5P8WAT9_9NOSO|nr:hypothetical protein [Nostoc sphaeroides]MCC5632860.1 hypothetical protein [Nostoc sphaeroides CHAB 2801]MCC5633032.1 hypothetical protein [Nostoc sphaeroides CHAB 2801]MCC5633569.1 hypothetical protein [Nostoc sphaeroides CHAB 2801]MCC5633693.1 hypothetical protein [Nostoc sphaeroides CHAB 2801]QFS49683.1 hypothetical protein GXM_07177 [Nostoc sphaeroides CCNUC1]
MLDWWEKNFATCELGDRRLNERAFVFWLRYKSRIWQSTVGNIQRRKRT